MARVSSRRVALLTSSTKPRDEVVHTLALAEALARSGAQVTVWSLATGDAGFFRPVDPAVRTRLVPAPTTGTAPPAERVLRSIEALEVAFAAEARDYDVVHAQDCVSTNAALPHRQDVIRTVHQLDPVPAPQLAASHERALRDPAAHLCASLSIAGDLSADWDACAEVIPNGVEANRFAEAAADDPIAACNRDRWSERFGRFVLTVGGIEPRKATLDLVEAMGRLPALGHPDVCLVVAGGDTRVDAREYRSAVGRRAAELGVRPVVLGPVAHEDLPSLVAAADVFAFPSRQEGFGLAALEALAAGTPLVARDLPVLREVFDGAAAFAEDSDDLAQALAACLSGNPEPGRAEVGRALADRLSWDVAAASHLDFYDRHLAAGRPGSSTPKSTPSVKHAERAMPVAVAEVGAASADPMLAGS